MDQRKGLFHERNRIFLWVLLISFLLLTFFLVRFFFLSYQLGYFPFLCKVFFFFCLSFWFTFLFFLFNEWGNVQFSDFISRVEKEIREVINQERKEIFFRENSPWKIDYLNRLIEQNLKKTRKFEKEFQTQVDALKSMRHNFEGKDLKELSEKHGSFLVFLENYEQ